LGCPSFFVLLCFIASFRFIFIFYFRYLELDSKTCIILSYVDTSNNNIQSNANYFQAFDILLRKLQKYVPFGASVADLYAGAGVIGLSLAATRKCRQEPR